MTQINSRPVRYHLRVPFKSAFSKSEEEALFEVLRRGDIDDVSFFVPHEESCSPGLGTTEECERCVERLTPLFERLRNDGIDPSINIWWTQGFSHFSGMPRDQHGDFDFRWAVRPDGYTSRVIACPQDPVWLEQTRKMYGMFASLKPVRLWVDDDVRMTARADMHSACYCDVCMQDMERRVGKRIEREALPLAILADPPNPVREAWLEFQDEVYHQMIVGLVRAVHEVSPQTHITSCHSGIEVQCAEGLRWDRYLDSLGKPKPYFRPGLGVYTERPAPACVNGLSKCRLAQSILGDRVTLVPEIESYPHSRFNKSTRSVKAHMLLSQLMGIPDISLNVYRCTGRIDLETQHEDAWSRMLGKTKPYFQSVSDLDIRCDQFRGISLYFHEEESRYVRGVTEESKPIFLYRRRPFDNALPMLGFATQYGEGNVIAFEGEHVSCLSDAECKERFSHGVLLDGRAAESLLLDGHGSLAGITGQKPDVGGTREIIEDDAFGLAGEPINIRWEGEAKQFNWMSDARVASTICDYGGKQTGHGLVLFENELGGRVAVLPYDSQLEPYSLGEPHQALCSPSFMAFSRQAQLKAVLEWLNRGPVPLFVPNAPSCYPMLARQSDRLIVSVTNFLPDPIENLTLELGEPDLKGGVVRYLKEDASWAVVPDAVFTHDDSRLVLRTPLSVDYLQAAVLVIEEIK